jgi:membrane glycosyltransferase
VGTLKIFGYLDHLGEILSGRDAGWSGGARGATQTRLWSLLRLHRATLATGLAIAGIAWVTAPGMLVWFSPVIVGLLAAPLTDWLGSHASLKTLMRGRGLLTVPEELRRPPIFWRRETVERIYDGAVTLCGGFEMLFRSREAVAKQAAAAPNPPSPQRGRPEALELLTDSKLAEADSLGELYGWLTKAERSAVLASSERIWKLHSLSDPLAEGPRSRSAS